MDLRRSISDFLVSESFQGDSSPSVFFLVCLNLGLFLAVSTGRCGRDGVFCVVRWQSCKTGAQVAFQLQGRAVYLTPPWTLVPFTGRLSAGQEFVIVVTAPNVGCQGYIPPPFMHRKVRTSIRPMRQCLTEASRPAGLQAFESRPAWYARLSEPSVLQVYA